MRTDKVRSLDAEMRDVFQKQGLAAYKKAEVYTAALHKYLAHVKRSDQEGGEMTLGFLEENKTEVEKTLETPEDPNPVVQEVLDVHPLYQKNAHVLLRNLGQRKHISSWVNQGSFIYKGDVIKGLSLLELLQCVLHTCAPSSLRTPGMLL